MSKHFQAAAVQITVSLLTILAIVACGRDGSSKKGNIQDSDAVEYDLPLQLKNLDSLNQKEKTTILKLQNHQKISFKTLTEMALRREIKIAQRNEANVETLQNFIKSIIPRVQNNGNRAQTKIAYEEKLRGVHRNIALSFNSEASSVVHVALDNQINAYSGTMLYQYIRRQMSAAAFSLQNEVVIFENGNILPGYLVKGANGFALIGIDTDKSGGARRFMGMTKALAPNIRVVDAELFLIMELFQDVIANPHQVAQVALEKTATRYGITTPQILSIMSELKTNPATLKQMNHSIFAFGQSKYPIPTATLVRPVSSDNGAATDEIFLNSTGTHPPGANADKTKKP